MALQSHAWPNDERGSDDEDFTFGIDALSLLDSEPDGHRGWHQLKDRLLEGFSKKNLFFNFTSFVSALSSNPGLKSDLNFRNFRARP